MSTDENICTCESLPNKEIVQAVLRESSQTDSYEDDAEGAISP